MVQDLSAELNALSQLRDSEELFRNVFEFCPEPLALLDCSIQNIVTVNESFSEVFGVTKEFVQGQDIVGFAKLFDDQGYADILNTALNNSALEEKSYKLKSGTGKTIYLYPSYTKFEICGSPHALLLFIDNTDIVKERLKNHQ